ncbi:MAG: hypothetical protein PHY93_07055 [Bacteriovorax sp.]|nr:hypothetical protein [Bacteriovorax sp.]
MKVNSKILALLVASLSTFSAYSKTPSKDCSDCNRKTIAAETMPDKRSALELKNALAEPIELASKSSLVITKNDIARAPAGQNTKDDYQYIFCHKFDQIEWQSVASLITKEMEPTGYSVEDFFKAPACQPGGYSDAVKSPILHVIADDPSKRVKFLDIIWLYYSKKRNDPAKFAEVVNAKNTKGETLLDYFESQKRNDSYNTGLQADADKIIAIACSHGAVFSVYKDKKCP